MKNKKPLILGVIVLGTLALLFLALRFFTGGGASSPDFDEVRIEREGSTLTVGKNGSVRLLTDQGLFEQEWDSSKTSAFFDYVTANLLVEGEYTQNGSSVTIVGSSAESDELINIVISETESGGGGSGGGGSGGGGGQSPTSPPGSNPTPKPGGNPTPTPGVKSECLFWRISYCVKFPSPSPTPTPAPQGQEVIQAANCAEWLGQQTSATVIDNTVCIEE